jgi:hypothetical protein
MSYKRFSVALRALVLSAIFLVSCTPTKVVAPLEQGTWQVGGTLGKPKVNDGSLPVLGLYAAHGKTDQVSEYAGLQLSSLLMGAIHVEAGRVIGLKAPIGFTPGISWSYGGQLLVSSRDAAVRLYPEAGINAYWKYGPHLLNASANTWVDPTWYWTEYDQGQILAPSFGLGYRFRYKWFEAQAEYKLLNPTREIRIPQANVPSTFGLGGKGLYWGVALNF